MLVVSLSQSCRQPLPFPLSSRSPSIHYNTKCDFFKERKKETEKNGFADYYCHLQLLPLLLLQSFNRASQLNQPKNFPLTQFKWCGIVVWLGDSHSGIFSVRSFIHTFSVAFFTLIFTNAFILDVDCLQFTAFASKFAGQSMYLWLLSYKIVIIIIICEFLLCDAVSVCIVYVCSRAHTIHWIVRIV